MYVIINILGKQYKVFKNIKIRVDRINLNLNSLIILNNILLFSSKKYFIINSFFLNKIFLLGRIINHGKFKKINIIKFKRRKGYKKKIGFKKKYTELLIESINFKFLNILNGSKKIRRFF